MPPRQQHDPFTDSSSLRPTAQSRGSQHSVRSNASTASSRSRHQRELFAPPASRRANSRATPRVEDEVFADESDEDGMATPRSPRARVEPASPAGKRGKDKSEPEPEPERDMVNRREDGSFLIEIPGMDELWNQHAQALEFQDEAKAKALDDHYNKVAREYFTSGTAIPGSKTSKKQLEAYDAYKEPMMAHTRDKVQRHLDETAWIKLEALAIRRLVKGAAKRPRGTKRKRGRDKMTEDEKEEALLQSINPFEVCIR